MTVTAVCLCIRRGDADDRTDVRVTRFLGSRAFFVECVPTAYGPKINCSGFGWRADGITSILPLKDGKTVLLFGVVHNGDLGMLTANDRSFMYTYAKDENQKPVPTVDLG